MWFRFTKPFRFKPSAGAGQLTVVYQPGVYNVTKDCAVKAEAAGVGKPTNPTKATASDADQD